jgi:hypothetical protein
MKTQTLPACTTYRDATYSNVIWENHSGKLKRVILDPGGAGECEPLTDNEGRTEETFCFYRHFNGRLWEYRNNKAA